MDPDSPANYKTKEKMLRRKDNVPEALGTPIMQGVEDTILSMANAIDDYVQGERNRNVTYLSKLSSQVLNKTITNKINIYSETVEGLKKRSIGPKKTFEEV